jgi:hypothetical protein
MGLRKSYLAAGVAAAALLWSAASPAQWAWRDGDGRMVFSDQPPPKTVPAKDIVRQPPATPRSQRLVTDLPTDAVPTDAATDAKPQAAPSAPAARPAAPTVTDREIESRRRQIETADAEKKAADEANQKAKTAENCDRLRAYQRALDGGFRVARVNAQGQQEFLDDAARKAETERTRAEIEQQCR